MEIAFIAFKLIMVKDLLLLQEVYDVLKNRQQLMNFVYDSKFVLSCKPVHYEWYELPEDPDLWERLYDDKKSATYKNPVCRYIICSSFSNAYTLDIPIGWH